MPHLRIEYSAGLAAKADMAALCMAVHAAMVQAQRYFPLAGIRVRAFQADYSLVADALPKTILPHCRCQLAQGGPRPHWHRLAT